MLLKLNFLSTEQKTKVRRERVSWLFNRISLIVFFAAILISAALLLTYYALSGQWSRVQAENYQANTSFSQRVSQINGLAKFVQTISQEQTVWSGLFIGIAASTPNTVRLSALFLDSDKKTLSLRGFAPSRADLLTLQNNLKSLNRFKAIDLPVQNLAQKENIDFIINATLP